MEEQLFVQVPVHKAYFKFTLPVVLSMVVSLIYNMTDTFFIGQTGDTNQVAAVSLCAPIFTLLIALGDIFGLGGSSVISRLLGEKREDDVRRISSFCFYGAIACGLIVCIILFCIRPGALSLLGADSHTMQYASQYYIWMAVGSPFIILSLTPANILRTEGMATASMIGSILGTIVNIILDPIFILALDMGVIGAAIATVLGNVVSVAFFIYVLEKKSKKFSIRLKDCHVHLSEAKDVLMIGIPASLTNLMQSIGTMVMNRYLYTYGNTYIASMGIAMKIILIITLILVGFSFGVQPLIGYNYGAKNRKRLKEVMRFTFFFEITLSVLMAVIMILVANPLIRCFMTDPAIIDAGSTMLRILSVSAPFVSVIMICTVTFQATGKAWQAMLLSIARQGIIFIPVIVLAHMFFGYSGVIASQTIADVITFLLAILFYRGVFKKLS